MSARTAPMGFAIYFIDVLACLLFCLVLALVGARFGTERTLDLALPELPDRVEAGSDLSGTTIDVRSEDGRTQIALDGDLVSLEELEARLAASPPPSVVLRAEGSVLSGVIASVHGAGVHDIRLAYESATEGATP